MAAESIWPGMFQAEAGRGSKANATSAREAISDTAASYAISGEQGERKKVLDNRQRSAVNTPVWGRKPSSFYWLV